VSDHDQSFPGAGGDRVLRVLDDFPFARLADDHEIDIVFAELRNPWKLTRLHKCRVGRPADGVCDQIHHGADLAGCYRSPVQAPAARSTSRSWFHAALLWLPEQYTARFADIVPNPGAGDTDQVTVVFVKSFEDTNARSFRILEVDGLSNDRDRHWVAGNVVRVGASNRPNYYRESVERLLFV
jgi:hypothetical protein